MLLTNITFNITPDDSSDNLIWSDYIALGGTLVVVVLFIIERFIATKTAGKELNRKWYYDSLIAPHLEMVEAFYKETLDAYKVAFATISSSLGAPNILSIKSTQSSIIQELKRELEFDFINLVSTNIPSLSQLLADHMLTLEDKAVNSLDDTTLPTSSVNSFRDFLVAHKGYLYKLMFETLKNPKL